MQAGRPNAAILQLQSTLSSYPESGVSKVPLSLLLAEAYRSAGKYKLAAQTLQELLPQNRNSAAVRIRLAADYESLGSFEDAAAQYPQAALLQFEEAERLKPDEVQIHVALARILSELGRKDQAQQERISAERLINAQRNREQASFCIGIGNTALHNGDLQKAEAQFRDALRYDPQDARALSNLGLVLALMHHPEEGRLELQKAIALDGKLALAYNALGVSYAEEGRVAEAQTAFDRAIQIEPEYAEAKNNLGALYAKSGKDTEAVALFNQATEDSPQYPQSYLNWGLVLANQGNASLAKAMFEKALQLSPDLAQARKALEIVQGDAKTHN
jgi:superkiller protein 3